MDTIKIICGFLMGFSVAQIIVMAVRNNLIGMSIFIALAILACFTMSLVNKND